MRESNIKYWNSLSEEEKTERIAPWIEAGMKFSKKFSNTYLERIMKAIFQKYEVEYIHQKRIGRRWFDFLIPAKNLIIECDGDWAHSSDQARQNDREKEILAKSKGYRVKRLSELRINELALVHSIKY